MVLTPDGTVVVRSYELIEELGRGAAGVVWQARASATGREYAVKILHHDGRGAPKAVARFLQERDILLRLRHENLVAVQRHYLEASGKLYDPTVGDDGASAGDGIGHSEFAGPTFSPDGQWLFVNIQVPGITCAITGPWGDLGL